MWLLHQLSGGWQLGPGNSSRYRASLLCDILQEVTLVDLQLAVQCTLVSGGILVIVNCLHAGTCMLPHDAWHSWDCVAECNRERRVQIALKPSVPSVPFPAVRADADLSLAALRTLRSTSEQHHVQLCVTSALE